MFWTMSAKVEAIELKMELLVSLINSSYITNIFTIETTLEFPVDNVKTHAFFSQRFQHKIPFLKKQVIQLRFYVSLKENFAALFL